MLLYFFFFLWTKWGKMAQCLVQWVSSPLGRFGAQRYGLSQWSQQWHSDPGWNCTLFCQINPRGRCFVLKLLDKWLYRAHVKFSLLRLHFLDIQKLEYWIWPRVEWFNPALTFRLLWSFWHNSNAVVNFFFFFTFWWSISTFGLTLDAETLFNWHFQ